MLGDDPNKPHAEFNPYQPGVDAHLPDREAQLAPGATDPRAKRSAVLGGIAAALYWLPPVAMVLGIFAWLQGRAFLNDWYQDSQIRGKGAAIAGRVMGIGSVLVALFMGLYYLWIFSNLYSPAAPPY